VDGGGLGRDGMGASLIGVTAPRSKLAFKAISMAIFPLSERKKMTRNSQPL
jgi:hypothetical protein